MEEKIKAKFLTILEEAMDDIKCRCYDSKVRPFDILLFRDSDILGGVVSFVQKLNLGAGEYTHVGIVVNRDILPFLLETDQRRNKRLGLDLDYKHLYIWESHPSIPYPDPVTGKLSNGVQIHFLADRLKRATTPVDLGQLTTGMNPLDKEKNFSLKEIQDIMMSLYKKYEGSVWDFNLLTVANSVFDCKNCLDPSDERVFRSELIAEILFSFKVLDMDPTLVAPMELVGFDEVDDIKLIDTIVTHLSVSDLDT